MPESGGNPGAPPLCLRCLWPRPHLPFHCLQNYAWWRRGPRGRLSTKGLAWALSPAWRSCFPHLCSRRRVPPRGRGQRCSSCPPSLVCLAPYAFKNMISDLPAPKEREQALRHAVSDVKTSFFKLGSYFLSPCSIYPPPPTSPSATCKGQDRERPAVSQRPSWNGLGHRSLQSPGTDELCQAGGPFPAPGPAGEKPEPTLKLPGSGRSRRSFLGSSGLRGRREPGSLRSR